MLETVLGILLCVLLVISTVVYGIFVVLLIKTEIRDRKRKMKSNE
jgi:uncharacterized membrane protein YciS (DUF1049 family)